MMLYLFLLLSGLILFLLKRQHSYWKRRGIAQLEPEFLFGNIKKLVLKQETIDDIIQNAYTELRAKKQTHGGIYFMYTPLWIPVDLELIKQILTTDYEYFNSHGPYIHETDIYSKNLFHVEGNKWKKLRTKLTPTFTSGKLKMMFDSINMLATRINQKVETLVANGDCIELKEFTTCFGTDVVASCFFGIESDCLNHPESPFREHGKLIFEPRAVSFFLERMINWDLLALFGHTELNKKVMDFFTNLVRDTIEYRENNNIHRKDYLNLLLELKNKGTVEENGDSGKENGIFSFEDIVANMIIMYAAGFETSSSTTSYLMYELAKNQDIQDKLRKEILKVLGNRSPKELTYEDLTNMKYCEMCINETLRRYPPVSQIPRKCIKTYKIPGTNQVIEKGTLTFVPAWVLQTDPDYYPDPLTFNPENFSTENKDSRPEYAFLGFGGGPRLCIGFRFAIMQIKIVMTNFLAGYKYTLNPKTPTSLSFMQNTFTLTARENLLLDITPINKL